MNPTKNIVRATEALVNSELSIPSKSVRVGVSCEVEDELVLVVVVEGEVTSSLPK